ncbi:MAG: hypothetical protein U0Z44_20645 [Kouleothrix sp.]
MRDSNLVRLSQALFERLLQRYPQAMTQIARSIVQRVRELERGAPLVQPWRVRDSAGRRRAAGHIHRLIWPRP